MLGSELGAYTEIGARTKLLEVTLGDYSYVVNDSDIAYTTIGKGASGAGRAWGLGLTKETLGVSSRHAFGRGCLQR